MHRAALAGFVPRRVVQRLTPAQAAERRLPPALAGMLAAGLGNARLCLHRDDLQPARRDAGTRWEQQLSGARHHARTTE